MGGYPPTTQAEKNRFLAKLKSSVGNVAAAARAAGIARSTVYKLRDTDLDFAMAMDEVLESVYDDMEQELHRRAVKGVPEPVYYKGRIVGQIRKKSDRLLEFALKGVRPEKYRDRVDVNQNVAGSLDLGIEAAIKQIYGRTDGEDEGTGEPLEAEDITGSDPVPDFGESERDPE